MDESQHANADEARDNLRCERYLLEDDRIGECRNDEEGADPFCAGANDSVALPVEDRATESRVGGEPTVETLRPF